MVVDHQLGRLLEISANPTKDPSATLRVDVEFVRSPRRRIAFRAEDSSTGLPTLMTATSETMNELGRLNALVFGFEVGLTICSDC
jgi:hypothetical protein